MAGILLYYEQALPDTDPEGLARTVDEVFNQYGTDGVEVPNHGVDDTEVDIELLCNVWSSSGQYEGYILYRVK
jgi:hypothetical protein